MINEARQDLENMKVDMAELEDLRVMQQDIQRQEKANAELISSQAKRLEELDALYKEEQVRLEGRPWHHLVDMLARRGPVGLAATSTIRHAINF